MQSLFLTLNVDCLNVFNINFLMMFFIEHFLIFLFKYLKCKFLLQHLQLVQALDD